MMNKLLQKAVIALAALASLMGPLTPAFAQINQPPTWVFARAYNGWQLIGQQANTYTFNGGVCNFTPYNNGNTPSFFVFSGTQGASTVYFPVAIVDANPALSEIATPTSTTQGASTCGFAASTVNQHVSFILQSGTAGLQEAIVTQQQSTPVFNVLLDKYWYQSVAGLPGAPTAASLIATVTGNSNVSIVDTTTSPWTTYSWNGVKYAAVQSTAGYPNLGVSSYTAIAAPTALSTAAATNGLITTATTGGTIPASSTYRLAVTYVDANGGETLISTDSASTATIATGSGTATNTISVTSPAAATGAVGYRLYMTAASGASKAEILYSPACSTSLSFPLQTTLPASTVCPIGATATISAIVTGTATIPLTASAFPRTSATSGSYPPFAAQGSQATTVAGTLGVINFPAGYLNSLGRSVQYCGTLSATTNSTPGTLALKAVLASVYGVTSITPWTVTSGTTTASAVVNAPFCVTFTTAATGTSGTLWVHGWADFDLTGAGVGVEAQDLNVAVSSAVDLTKADTLSFTLTPTTTGTTASQLTQLNAYPSN